MTNDVKMLLMQKLNNDPNSIEKKVASAISGGLLLVAVAILMAFFRAYII